MSRLFVSQSTLASFLIIGIVISALLIALTSAKSIPETESVPSDSSDSDADYNESPSGKLIAPAPAPNRNKLTPAAFLSVAAPAAQRQWKCAVKGERCGKIGNEWKSCCRSFTACVGKDPTKMVCDH